MMFDRNLLIRKARQLLGKPMWTVCPENVQFESHNYCNLKCVYCNPQNCFSLPKGRMPTETIRQIVNSFHDTPLWSFAPFMNGEWLLEDRAQEILGIIAETGTQAVIDTNGTLYDYRERLVHPNLKIVRFTISAATPETYLKVHGKPLLRQALKTFDWFNRHKHPNQTAWLHFIANKHNIHEESTWLNLFRGYNHTVFPLHTSPIQQNSEKSKTQATKTIHYADGTVKVPEHKTEPCQCWNIMGISWDGRILQCVDFPYEYNYGRVGEVDLLEAWKERNRNMMDNPCCNGCSLRLPHYKKVFDKYLRN